MNQTLRTFAVLLLCLLAPLRGAGQSADFKIKWTTVGEVVSPAGKDTATMQPETKIARVDVQPTIIELAVGKELCIDSLQVRAFDADRKPVAGVQLEIAVREDQRQPLQLTRSKGICIRPARSGEYPVRFTSKVHAADDTQRGAQIFVRAK